MTDHTQARFFNAVCASLLAASLSCPLAGQQAVPDAPVSTASAQTPDTPLRLTVVAAEQIAVRNNPRMSIARLLALAQAQVTREVRAAEMPVATVDLTAVDAHDGSRITAGGLNNSSIYNRAAGGMNVSQLITDFGRTHHLVLSAQSDARAQLDAQRATEQDITLAVDQAFYQALTSQAVLKVAEQTVAQRQATVDQIIALTANKLRSDLDLSFSNVQLSQARLLLLDAQNSAQSTMANLNALLGSEKDDSYLLVDDAGAVPEPAPQDAEVMVQLAFKARPDLASLDENYNAARQFSAAEHSLWKPTVSALAAVGGTPLRADQVTSSWYGAAGANIQIPVFNGFLYSARAKEAGLRSNTAQEQVRNLRNGIARDVRTAVLNAQAAFQRIAVTQQLLDHSNMALDLAQTRYKLGLSGIVELSQAQLEQTQAQIGYANAKYAYRLAQAELRYQTGQ